MWLPTIEGEVEATSISGLEGMKKLDGGERMAWLLG